MADTPDVLKRLEEIGKQTGATWDDVRFLLKLTRALLESQEELMEETRGHACCKAPNNPCAACNALDRAEKVRKGEV